MPDLMVVYGTKELHDWAAPALRSAGHRVTGVASCHRATSLLRSQPFDALLVDVAPPEEQRFKFLRKLRRPLRKPKVIAISSARHGLSASFRLMACRALGADAILFQPCSSDELVEVVRTVLGRR